jgi:hypothetical protein
MVHSPRYLVRVLVTEKGFSFNRFPIRPECINFRQNHVAESVKIERIGGTQFLTERTPGTSEQQPEEFGIEQRRTEGRREIGSRLFQQLQVAFFASRNPSSFLHVLEELAKIFFFKGFHARKSNTNTSRRCAARHHAV